MLKMVRRKLRAAFGDMKLNRKIQISTALIILPFLILLIGLFLGIYSYHRQYDAMIMHMPRAERFGIDFKKEFDEKIDRLVVGRATFEELNPYEDIRQARSIMRDLAGHAGQMENEHRAQTVIALLDDLEGYVRRIEDSKKVGRQDTIAVSDVWNTTALIQDTVLEYTYLETKGMERVHADVSGSLGQMSVLSVVIFTVLLCAAIVFSVVVPNRIARPILHLDDVSKQVAALPDPIASMIDTAERAGDMSAKDRNEEIDRVSGSLRGVADTFCAFIANLEEKVKERTLDLQTANEALGENMDKLQLILDSTAEAIYGINKEGNCTFCNAACISILGYRHQDDLLGKNMHRQIHHSRKDGSPLPIRECRILKAFLEGRGTQADDEVFWRADGTCFDVEYYSYPQFKDGAIIGAVVTFLDNTERKRAEEHIIYLSRHDSLTGLYNRMYFEEALRGLDNPDNFPLSIIFADINGLKLTNDIFGHAAGDRLVKKAAETLKEVCREQDIAARVGGDEFIVLLPGTRADDASRITGRIKDRFSKEKIAAIKCSMSMGHDTKTDADQEIERTMANAENNMYKEKTLERKSVDADMLGAIIMTLHDKRAQERQHSEAVSQLCEKIGRKMGMDETKVARLKKAGFLHDIGKVVWDETSISEKGALPEGEAKKVQQHAVIGYRILNLFDDTLDLAEDVYCHHERWDGAGYPKGQKGEEIPLFARIIAVAGSYDRMVRGAAGKAGISGPAALLEIRRNAGARFDPRVVEAFLAVMEEKP